MDEHHRGRFLFDTGFTTTTINAAAADRWQLAAGGGPLLETTDATGTVKNVARYARLECLQLGDTRYDPLDAPVIAFPSQLQADGVIGMNAMAPLAWIVDVPAGRLRAVDPRHLEQRLTELYPGPSWTSVPLRRDGGGWQLELDIARPEPVRVTLKLDTGAESSSLPTALIASLGLPDGRAERQRQLDAEAEGWRRLLAAQGLVGSVRVDATGDRASVWGQEVNQWHLLDGLRLGRATFDPLPVTGCADRTGLLGADVLGKVVWALDGPNDRLLVRDP